MRLSNLCHKKRSGVWWIDAPKWNTWDSLSLPIFSRVILSQISTKVNKRYNFAPGPKVYLKMDEGTGTAANDSSGNANTGTVSTGTWTPLDMSRANYLTGWTTGKYGKGVSVGDFSY